MADLRHDVSKRCAEAVLHQTNSFACRGQRHACPRGAMRDARRLDHRGEEGDRLLRPALLPAQAGEAHRSAQFTGLCVLPSRDVDALLNGRLGLAHRPGAGEQGLAPEPIKLGFKRRSAHLFDRLQPGGGRRERRFGLADRQLRIGLQRQQPTLEPPRP